VPFQPLRNAEQPDDGRRFDPVAKDGRAEDGDDHQDVDIERARSQRAHGATRRRRNR
jgi:hypothetical protein